MHFPPVLRGGEPEDLGASLMPGAERLSAKDIASLFGSTLAPSAQRHVAACLWRIYTHTTPGDTLAPIVGEWLRTLRAPPGTRATLGHALMHYASALDALSEAKPSYGALRAGTHALYGFHMALNTTLIELGALPLVASPYVKLGATPRVGPAKLHMFAIAPDGEADPDVSLFAPSAEFVRGVDRACCAVLAELRARAPDALAPHLAEAWDARSRLNKSFRRRGARPRLGK